MPSYWTTLAQVMVRCLMAYNLTEFWLNHPWTFVSSCHDPHQATTSQIIEARSLYTMYMATGTWDNIGSGNGMLSNGTSQLPIQSWDTIHGHLCYPSHGLHWGFANLLMPSGCIWRQELGPLDSNNNLSNVIKQLLSDLILTLTYPIRQNHTWIR